MAHKLSIKSLSRLLTTILPDTDLSIITYISGIIEESILKNEINDWYHIHHILYDTLLMYQICADQQESQQISQSILQQLITNKYITDINTKKQTLLQYIREHQDHQYTKNIMARYSEDGIWYSAQITEYKLDETKNDNDCTINCTVNVVYTEYGNSEWIDVLDVKLPSYWIVKKQKTYEQEMEEKMQNDTISTAEYSQFCFRLFGSVFIQYLGGTMVNELMKINFIDNNIISIYYGNKLRVNCCNLDWKSRFNRYQTFISDKKAIYQTLARSAPFQSVFRIYKVKKEKMLKELGEELMEEEVEETFDENDEQNDEKQDVEDETNKDEDIADILGIKHRILLSLILDNIYNVINGNSFKMNVCDIKELSEHKMNIKFVEKLILTSINYKDLVKMNPFINFKRDDVVDDNKLYCDYNMKFLSISGTNYKRSILSGRLYEELESIDDLDKLGDWMETIRPELEKLFVSKLMNIKKYYVAELEFKQSRRYYNYRGDMDYTINKNKCIVIFAWCYDHSIFMYRDLFSKC